MQGQNPQLEQTLQSIWYDYTQITPTALEIKQLFESQGETVINDHIAFRTLNLPDLSIEVFAKPFLELGYQPKDEYHFEAKKLFARYYHHPDPNQPKIFISELKLEECSAFVQKYINEMVKGADIKTDQLYKAGRPWDIHYPTYLELKQESEYAAWLSAFGFRANHFTVSVNHLKNFSDLEAVNALLKENGHQLNEQGGEIKGSKEVLLEQSSTLAYHQKVRFTHGHETIPSCYYEFALRYKNEQNELYQGFVTQSADKIFESTDKGQ
jgi:hypothetical protein